MYMFSHHRRETGGEINCTWIWCDAGLGDDGWLWMMEQSDGILEWKDLFQGINGSKILSDGICLATVTAVVQGMAMEGPHTAD